MLIASLLILAGLFLLMRMHVAAPVLELRRTRGPLEQLLDTTNVKDYGAVGDGVADDYNAIMAAIASGKNVFFPAGTYNITTQIIISTENAVMFGVGFESKITSANLINPIKLNGVENVTFKDMAFETTVVQPVENVYGIIHSLNTEVKNVEFVRCLFTAPDANTNGVKIINETASISDNVRFSCCVFRDLCRMGIEWQNHAVDTVKRYRGVIIENCEFDGIGATVGYGYAISLSGYGENCLITGNVFKDIKLGVELVGASDTTVSANKFESFLTTGKPFSFTGSRVMNRNRVVHNTMAAAAPASTYIWSQDDLVMHGNHWLHDASYVYFRDVNRLRASDETYNTSGSYAVYIESATGSANNQFVNCIITNARSGANFSTFRAYGANTTDTWLIGCNIVTGTGGVAYDGSNSAQTPKVYMSKRGASSPTFLNDIVPAGYSAKTGFFKTAGAGVSTTSVTVDLGSSGSWLPAIVSVRVRAIKNDATGSAYTENRLYIRHQGSTNVVVDNNQVIGAASGLTITTSAAGTVLTITATHGTVTGANLYFMWDVEVDSYNTPVIA